MRVGVDNSGHLLCLYSCKRKITRWPRLPFSTWFMLLHYPVLPPGYATFQTGSMNLMYLLLTVHCGVGWIFDKMKINRWTGKPQTLPYIKTAISILTLKWLQDIITNADALLEVNFATLIAVGSWFISPVLAGVVSVLLFYICKYFILSKVRVNFLWSFIIVWTTVFIIRTAAFNSCYRMNGY